MSSLNIRMGGLLCLILSVLLASCGSGGGGGGTSTSTPPAATSPWAVKLAPPTRRHYAAAAVYDNKLYLMGGLLINSDPNSTYGAVTALVEIYDPVTNSWTTGVSLPTARMGLVAAVVNGKIYAIGGRTDPVDTSTSVATVAEFTPGATVGSGTWTTRTSLSGPRYFAGGATLATGDHIVVAGGESSGSLLVTVEEFNPISGPNGAWTGRPFMSSARSRFAMTEAGGKLYTAGGYGGGGSPWLGTVEEYDPGTGWTLKTSMLNVRGHAVSAFLNSRLLVAGGESTAGSLTVLESYDPSSNTWTTKTPAPFAFTRAAGGAIGNKLYIVGDGFTLEYDPAKETL